MTNENNQKREVILLLKELNIQPNLSGYEYMKSALLMLSGNRRPLYGRMSNQLYPKIAEQFGSKGSRVERAIRHAIELAYTDNGLKVLKEWRDKPANCEFLAACLEKLELDALAKVG